MPLIVREDSGTMCRCGSRYAFTEYSDGTIRYEFSQRFRNGTIMTEWRTVASWGDFEMAVELYNDAWHGVRH